MDNIRNTFNLGPDGKGQVAYRHGALPDLPPVVQFKSESFSGTIPSVLEFVKNHIRNGRVLPKHVLVQFDELKLKLNVLFGFGFDQTHTLTSSVDLHPDFVSLGITGGSIFGDKIKPFQGSLMELRNKMRHLGHLFPSRDQHTTFINDLSNTTTTMSSEITAVKDDNGVTKDSKSFDAKWNGQRKSFTVLCPILKYDTSGRANPVSFSVDMRLSSENGVVSVWLESTDATDILLSQVKNLRDFVQNKVDEINGDTNEKTQPETTVDDLFTAELPEHSEDTREVDVTRHQIPSEFTPYAGKVTLLFN